MARSHSDYLSVYHLSEKVADFTPGSVLNESKHCLRLASNRKLRIEYPPIARPAKRAAQKGSS
jgi:hypothetical protein